MTQPPATGRHVTELLGGYSIGILDENERRAVDEHVPWCPTCQAELAEVGDAGRLLAALSPQEAVTLLGAESYQTPDPAPPEDDLVLRRTLRKVRSERRGKRFRTALSAAAAVVVIAAAAVGAGYQLGNTGNPEPAPSDPSATATATPPGTRVVTASNDRTGVDAKVTVLPAAGWVRLGVEVTGVEAGEHCALTAVTKSGDRIGAGSWVVTEKGSAPDAPPVPGAAAVALDDLTAIEIATVSGDVLVTVPL